LSEIEARIANIRAESKREGHTLTPQGARALAGEWYRWFVTQMAANKWPGSIWRDYRNRMWESLYGVIDVPGRSFDDVDMDYVRPFIADEANPENAQLGVNIVQGADISWDSVYDSNQRGFRGVPPAMNDSMLDLDGLSRVAGKGVFARFGGGQLQTVFTQKRLFICSIRVTPWYFRASGRVASS
jgi:hypothetical protein